jgi:glycosyltransferase involved in cell wall biosynthesis
VIVVNDGNPDSERFYEIAHRYAQTHPKEVTEVQVYQIGELPKHAKAKPGVVKFVSKENGGLGSARNFGISLASGRWLRNVFGYVWHFPCIR